MQTDPIIDTIDDTPRAKPSRGTSALHVLPSAAYPVAGFRQRFVADRARHNPHLTVAEWAVLIAVGFVAGCWFCGFTTKKMGISDPSPVVWDKIVAFWLVLFVTPATFTGQLWAFIVFRFFDMVKPSPIRYFDRQLKGGFGIMFDDIAAAFFTLLVIALWRMTV